MNKRRKSIVSHIVKPLILMAIVQTLLITAMLSAKGIYQQIYENALVMLEERTQNKHQNLMMDMTVNWSYLTSTKKNIADTIEHILIKNGYDYTAIATDPDLNETLLDAVSGDLLSRLRNNDTTGIFLILNGVGSAQAENSYAGIYLRDDQPDEETDDNHDITLLRGSPELINALQIKQSDDWHNTFTFSGGAANTANNYFYQPLIAALNGRLADTEHNGYWSPLFQMDQHEYRSQITYSEPVFTSDGKVIGILGIELSEELLHNYLSRGVFANSGRGCYFLGISEDGGKSYQKMVVGGAKYQQFFGDETMVLTPVAVSDNGRVQIDSTAVRGETMYGSVQKLSLYPLKSAFANQQWVLIGMVDSATLLTFPNTVRNIVILAASMAVVLGIFIAWVAGTKIVQPIIRLVNSMKTSDPNRPIVLEPTYISEIDSLSDAITALNRDVIESANRLTKILKIAGMSIGVFEIRKDGDMAYCSDDIFSLLDNENQYEKNNWIPKSVCIDMVRKAMTKRVEPSIYRVSDAKGVRFLRILKMQDEQGVIGTVMDVTTEMENRRKIEIERDHDMLTGILNRRAFEKLAKELFLIDGDTLGVAAMIMLDLDNLKYVNDTHGHDCGDGYIRTFAETLNLFNGKNSLIARRSGDEFLVFLYGGSSKQELWERIQTAWNRLLASDYQLPDGTAYRIRVSAGVAWYPQDTRSLTQLIHFADYAMYRVKRNAKGTLLEFDAHDYGEYTLYASGTEALERIISEQQIHFATQPVFKVSTGDVAGYSLLMRTNDPDLPNPQAIITIARKTNKLEQVERLVCFKGLEAAQVFAKQVKKTLLFFLNPIADQTLCQQDEHMIGERFGAILPHVVVELSRSDAEVEEQNKQKIQQVRLSGGKIAWIAKVDNYRKMNAHHFGDIDYIILSIEITHGIDHLQEKQAMAVACIAYARKHGAHVVAEGVETHSELRKLVQLGVDFVQGYHFGQPQYQPIQTDDLVAEEIRLLYLEKHKGVNG